MNSICKDCRRHEHVRIVPEEGEGEPQEWHECRMPLHQDPVTGERAEGIYDCYQRNHDGQCRTYQRKK